MKVLARFIAGLLLASAASASAAAQQPNQDYLQQLPPLIDREIFFGDPEIASARLSPDGQFVSFRKPHMNVMNIWVKRIDEPFDAARPLTADTARPVRGYFWSEDSRHVLYVQDKGGDENFHVYAVDPNADPEAATGVPPARDLTPYDNIQARIYAVPEATPGTIIVGLNDRDQQVHDVYRVSLETGERELILENTENVAGWTTDLEGRVRLATRVDSIGGTEILRVDGTELTVVYTCSNQESCGPSRFHKDGRRVYMSTNKGDDVDLGRLTLFDPVTGDETFVEQDPEGQVDFGGAEFSDVTDELVATYYVGDRLRIYPKDPQFARDLETLRNKLPEGEIYFGSATEDERLRLVRVTRDVDPGSTYLFDREAGNVELLYSTRPELPSEDLAPMQPIRYTARDGLEIPAYLTIPKGAEPRNLPVIVFPHGGPWGRDSWGYDSYAQYLANRGYAVLQPNFRGSVGYGKNFVNAGDREWGTGAMQHDITDGVTYLIEQGIADPTRVGIFGGSYGGYATLAGLAFTPEVYAAGISYVGPSNLITLLNSIPPYWRPLKAMFDVRVGDPDDPADRARLMQQSPLNSATDITAPLLVIQGANDPRVKKAESEQIVVALRDLGRDVEYMLAADEGHGFAGRENRLSVAVGLEQFFAKHLGGRSQEEIPDDIRQTLVALNVDVSTVELPMMVAAMGEVETAPLPVADGAALNAATMEYNMSMETGGRTLDIKMTRTIADETMEGRFVWRVVDAAETPTGMSVDTFWVDKVTLAPVRRSVAGGARVQLTYAKGAVTGEMQAGPRTMPINAELAAPVFGEGAALEMVIAGLPLTAGYETTLRTFDVLTQRVRPMKLAVTGSESTQCPAGTFDTYVVEIQPLDGDVAGTATLHVMRSAPHHVVRSTYKLPAMMGGGTATKELAKM